MATQHKALGGLLSYLRNVRKLRKRLNLPQHTGSRWWGQVSRQACLLPSPVRNTPAGSRDSRLFAQKIRHKQMTVTCGPWPRCGGSLGARSPITTERPLFISKEQMEWWKVTLAMNRETQIPVLVLLLSCVSLKQQSPFQQLTLDSFHFTTALFPCFCWNTRRQELCYFPSPFLFKLHMSKPGPREVSDILPKGTQLGCSVFHFHLPLSCLLSLPGL